MLPSIKRGDTFELPLVITERDLSGRVVPVDISGWTFRMEAREVGPTGRMVQRFDFEITDAVAGKGRFLASPQATRSWPVKTLFLDIRVLNGIGSIMTSQTMTMSVQEPVTR
jgi:hypothetical protein